MASVLASDPGSAATPALLAGLTVAQCRNIAAEIVYGSQAPLPPPPEALVNMYTTPPNSGSIGDSHEQDRQQFEGLLSGYYGTRDAAVLRLTNYVFALAVAYWLELQTQAATQALVTFPVNPGAPQPPIPTMSEAEVVFSGALGLDVPAAYFYALNYDLSALTNQDSLQQKQTRQQVVYGADQQSNLNRLTSALNAGVIGLPATLNPAQAVRIIEALEYPGRVDRGAVADRQRVAHGDLRDGLAGLRGRLGRAAELARFSDPGGLDDVPVRG